MAAPTSPRVEATSITTTTIRWVYGGSNQIAVYRSTDGSSYAEVTDAGTRVAVGTTSYDDTGLDVATKYWYKLSDDTGSTFSDVVTVWTHSCSGPVGDSIGTTLPPFLGEDDITPERLNEMERRIEEGLRGTVLAGDECVACPSDGAVVIDCSDGCRNWTVVADEDINSVSISWCNEFDGTLNFVVPPSTTVGICGFPAGFGFSGDECHQAKISGGTNGRTMSLGYGGGGGAGGGGGSAAAGSAGSRPGTNKGVGTSVGAGGGGGSGCTCVPGAAGQLTIKSCNANNSLDCASGKSNTLVACGGRGPYTWSNTGSVVLSRTAGASTKVTPPANTGSAVAGNAYRVACYICDGSSCSGGVCSGVGWTSLSIGCDDVFNSGNCSVPNTDACNAPTASALNKCCNNNTQVCTDPGAACTDFRTTCQGVTTMCDLRTAGMISDGCNPCGLQQGSTVTVTDSLGTEVTIILRA